MSLLSVDADALVERVDENGDPVIHHHVSLIIEDGVVVDRVSRDDRQVRFPDAPVIGGRGMVVTPGFINAHHHVGLTPFQLGSPDHPLELWFASRLALRDVDLRLDTLYSAFEMIASGVTTVQHLHSRAAGSADDVIQAGARVIDAYREIGMRASYSMALRDQNRLVYAADEAFVASLPVDLRPAMTAYFNRFTLSLAEQVRIFHALRALVAGDRARAVQLAPSNLHWLSDTALETAATLASDTGLPLHMHLVETPYQRVYARRRTGGTAFSHIHALGLTGPQLTIGHGVWMSEADIRLCAETGTRLCHNCSSNFRLKSGTAPLGRFVGEAVPVGLGIDEAGINDDRDMLQEMRLVLQAHRKPGIDTPHLSPAQVFRMATEGGAGTTPFGTRIGHLSIGAAADLVMFDWSRVTYPHQAAHSPLVDVLVHRARPSAIRAVVIDGRPVYRDGRFITVDRQDVLDAIASQMGRALTQTEEERRALAQAVMPHVRRFYEGWLEPGDLDSPVL